MIGIVDYGVGNLFSLKSSLNCIGAEAIVTADPEILTSCEKLILPGVGAFGDAAAKLRSTGLDKVVLSAADAGKPLMGICLGMQLLFEKSYEYGEHVGLALLPGQVVPMAGKLSENLRIPHIGWNALHIEKPNCPILRRTENGDHVYFVHSYFVDGNADCVAAWAEYDLKIAGAVWKDNVFGCQFHPEKSGDVGLNILKAFWEV